MLEDGDQFVSLVGVGEDQHLVAGPQPGVATNGEKLPAAHDEADPHVIGYVRDRLQTAAVGRRTAGDGEPVHAFGFVTQTYAERSRFGFDGAHQQPQAPHDGWDQGALHEDGEHDDDDDAVEPFARSGRARPG